MIFEAPCLRAASTITCAGSPIAQVDSPSTPAAASFVDRAVDDLLHARQGLIRIGDLVLGELEHRSVVRGPKRRRRLVGDRWHLLGDDHDHLAGGGLNDLDRAVERPVGVLLAVVADNDSLAHGRKHRTSAHRTGKERRVRRAPALIAQSCSASGFRQEPVRQNGTQSGKLRPASHPKARPPGTGATSRQPRRKESFWIRRFRVRP